MYMTRGPNTASTVLVPYGEPNHYGLIIEMKAKTTQMLNCYSASFIKSFYMDVYKGITGHIAFIYMYLQTKFIRQNIS